MEKIRIGLIFGGKSGEHEISLMSAAFVMEAIDYEKYDVVKIGITKQGKWLLYDGPDEKVSDGSWQQIAEEALAAQPEKYELVIMGTERSLKDVVDFAFPVLHGPNGEDGAVQGLFEIIGIPYAGSGVLGSAVAMDKIMAKELFARAGIPSCKHMPVLREAFFESTQDILDKVEEQLEYPIFVKPANMGSSVGMSKAKNRHMLEQGIKEASKYDRRLILEQGVDGREVETAILGNYKLKSLAVGEVVFSSEFYDYETKYCENSGTQIYIPADITESKKNEIRQIAEQAYRALDCRGFARVDCFIENQTGKVLINEINTIPGFTKYSMFPLLCKQEGMQDAQIIEDIINMGFSRT